MDLYESDGETPVVRDLQVDELYERTQSVCGRIVREVWSNDTAYFEPANEIGKKSGRTIRRILSRRMRLVRVLNVGWMNDINQKMIRMNDIWSMQRGDLNLLLSG
jgi:hypothetical protein